MLVLPAASSRAALIRCRDRDAGDFERDDLRPASQRMPCMSRSGSARISRRARRSSRFDADCTAGARCGRIDRDCRCVTRCGRWPSRGRSAACRNRAQKPRSAIVGTGEDRDRRAARPRRVRSSRDAGEGHERPAARLLAHAAMADVGAGRLGRRAGSAPRRTGSRPSGELAASTAPIEPPRPSFDRSSQNASAGKRHQRRGAGAQTRQMRRRFPAAYAR